MTATSKPTADHSERACLWCDKALRGRRRGSAARFCSAAHRNSYWTACRKLGEQAVVLGIASVTDLKSDLKACTLRWSEKEASPWPETGGAKQPIPEPLQRFAVEIPRALITALVSQHFEIRHAQRDDLPAIMAALTRLGKRPKGTETVESVKVLSY
jgi:hypothetical protein